MDKGEKLALQRLLVGHFVEKIPDDCAKSVAYVMQGDGVYERRRNKLGTFITKIASVEVPGLDSILEDGWELTVPKVPVSLLGTAIAFFRKVYSLHHSEAFVQFFYDTETKDYLLYCPKQVVSGASVKFERDASFETPARILVMEIHSHGSMSAFFSGTDDRDEKDDRFYGVVGNVTDYFPQMKLRLSMGGHTREVDVDDIFDIDEEMYHAESFPEDWPARVEKKKDEKKGKRKGKDMVVYGRGVGDKQVELFGEDALGTPFGKDATDDQYMNDLYSKYLGGDHLCSPHNFVHDDDDKGDYVRKDGKYWHVTRNGNEETWVEVDKNKVSERLYESLYGRFDGEGNDLWAPDEVAMEEFEMERYNQRCDEWLKEVEREDKVSTDERIQRPSSTFERHQIPTCDSPEFPSADDWRNWKF
jgi:PRTRC genetic system protein A